MSDAIRITVLGCRGSMPVSGEQVLRYGGATCCILVQHTSHSFILDAGTGLLNLNRHLRGETEISLLLTHPHFDHLAGLPLCPECFRKDFQFHIYGASHGGLTVQEQIGALMSPPLWPVGPHQLPAAFSFSPLERSMELNGALLESIEGTHPGGVSVIRLTIAGKRIVLMTDCTITEHNRDTLLSFCKDCDLLLCDGQYSDEEWPTHSGFGHNSWNMAARFARECGAKLARILHHDPTHTDEILDEARKQIREVFPACDLTFDGEEIVL